ncbi:MAG: hypothetical protein CVU99_02490 [Firmicutes bacterium HGW-Firmicutes-4]|jgi:hypothetical protein|nr:MAG: hypothetical protein CVU99_02490 [Firmicutes bacterium HGW-Firmicutes-4]
MNKEQFEEMDRLALPLVEFLRKHGNPGQGIEITQERIRLLSVDYSHRVAETPRHTKPKDPPPQPTKKGVCINIGPVDIGGAIEIDDVCKRLAEQIKKNHSGMA